MARITVEDCLKQIPNRYEMVKLAAKRVKKLAVDERPTVEPDDDKPTVIALREIAAGNVTLENIDSFNFDALEEEFSEQLNPTKTSYRIVRKLNKFAKLSMTAETKSISRYLQAKRVFRR